MLQAKLNLATGQEKSQRDALVVNHIHKVDYDQLKIENEQLQASDAKSNMRLLGCKRAYHALVQVWLEATILRLKMYSHNTDHFCFRWYINTIDPIDTQDMSKQRSAFQRVSQQTERILQGIQAFKENLRSKQPGPWEATSCPAVRKTSRKGFNLSGQPGCGYKRN